ncbi:MAG TPA: 2-succinyl-5-enolpyruvyl-6-hydroxy-3-cyclohexene-1-carboxylic-acid synthase [Thermoleophilaceae bacterium]|nr:2-succinyl-5-enolpyruvyl-6-hydroxy-3-cyclohexene-1-carboxylic-acid synthase [Thermoleophilaceae bacterium]
MPINRTYAPLQAFVDELIRCGMRHAVTSPGSRNAPLALTLAARPELEAVSVIDERSAGFVALGMAKATGRPVAVTCTSGTAAANLHPAVVEAFEARVPLVVMTADRPPELREVGAGQSIDQIKLYGSAAKWFVEVGTHEPSRETAVHHRGLACRAYWTAAGGRPGPVHLNFPLREPLAPRPEELAPTDWEGRPGGRPWTELREHATAPHAGDVHALAARIASAPRGAIVCGPVAEPVAEPAARLAAQCGWPLLAEPTSGVRCGDHDRSHVVAHYDVLLRAGDFAARHPPALVLRVGDMPTSKPLRTWVANAPQVVLDPHAAWHEPTRRAELLLQAAPGPTLDALAAAIEMRTAERDPAWLAAWRHADAVVPSALAAAPDGFEPKVLAALEPDLPDGAIVWLSSSMPVRDVEACFPQSPKRLRFLANRGANGIDGVVSSAAGAALATGAPTWLLTGELALLHDLGGAMAARRAGADLTIVCLDNGGGAIFDFLPVAEHADRELYERHIATPAGADLESLLPEVKFVRTDRRENVRLHRELVERVAEALSAGPRAGQTP